jgi:hypothetical protein
MARREPEGAFSAGDVVPRVSADTSDVITAAKLAKARDAVIRAAAAYVESERDERAGVKRRARTFQELVIAVTNHETIEIAHLGTVLAGAQDDYQPSDYPLQCAHCGEVLTNKAHFQTHMRNEHPA